MIGIVIPAHNEAELIGACLGAVGVAASHRRLRGEAVETIVVLDHCTDATRLVAQNHPVQVLAVEHRNVGRARAAGAEVMLAHGARWLAFTDADTSVSPDWLVDQLDLDADVVCDTVGVADWTPHGTLGGYLHRRFDATYLDVEGHSHIHGANLGVSARAYQTAGGFDALACGEDVALIEALKRTGARIAWSARPRVVTSARVYARASGGFADALLAHLADLEARLQTGLAITPEDALSRYLRTD